MAHPTPRTYFAVFVALMVLLVVTVAIAFIDLDRWLPGHGWSLLVAMSIAIVKGLLIILFFMHVKYGPRLVWAAAGAAFLWLGILIVLTFSDYLTRYHSPADNPRGEPRYLLQTLSAREAQQSSAGGPARSEG